MYFLFLEVQIRTAEAVPRTDQKSSAKVDDRVEAREILKVANKVAANWGDVAGFLDTDYFTIDQIEILKRQHTQPKTQARAMLEKWSSRSASKATRRSLIQAMVDADYGAQANDVFGEAMVKTATSS